MAYQGSPRLNWAFILETAFLVQPLQFPKTTWNHGPLMQLLEGPGSTWEQALFLLGLCSFQKSFKNGVYFCAMFGGCGGCVKMIYALVWPLKVLQEDPWKLHSLQNFWKSHENMFTSCMIFQSFCKDFLARGAGKLAFYDREREVSKLCSFSASSQFLSLPWTRKSF